MEIACQQAAQWLAMDHSIPFVSVNLAMRQIRQPRLIADVAGVLDRTRLPPHMLQLEITESAVMGDDPATLVRLRDLAALGVRLAIDTSVPATRTSPSAYPSGAFAKVGGPVR